tara:strand:- start:12 stop:260 length:249 start_codon:yes stop_codon:yes gene_type:complete
MPNKGLYYNINKKRKEGKTMRKKGEKGAPSEKDFKDAAKTAKMKDGGMYKEYGHGGLHTEKKVIKTRGTGAATKGLNFHSSG